MQRDHHTERQGGTLRQVRRVRAGQSPGEGLEIPDSRDIGHAQYNFMFIFHCFIFVIMMFR